MIRIFIIVFFMVLPFPGNSQLIPWYFKNPAFKTWISENNISSLTFHTLPSEHLFYTSGYYLAKNSQLTYVAYPEPNRVPEFEIKMNVYEYLFDELGNLDSLCIKTMKIDCKAPEKDSFDIDLGFREQLNELIKTDYSAQFKINLAWDHNLRPETQQVSTVLKDCKYTPMNYFIDPTGKTWAALQQSITIPGLKGTQVLNFRIEQTVKFKNEEPVFIREYPFTGDFWDPNYKYCSVVQLNDSVQTVFVQRSKYDYLYYMPTGKGRDTSYYEGSFILNSNGLRTFYTKNNYFKNNYDDFPQVQVTNLVNQRITTIRNFHGLSHIEDWKIPYGLFDYSGREITYYETIKYAISGFGSCEQYSCPVLEFREWFKREEWNKTMVYYSNSPEEKLKLLYTDMPYENGIKREFAAEYKINKRLQYFEHTGKNFQIYSYYPGSTIENKTEIEIRTNNGYLEIGNLDEESPSNVLKMSIGYR